MTAGFYNIATRELFVQQPPVPASVSIKPYMEGAELEYGLIWSMEAPHTTFRGADARSRNMFSSIGVVVPMNGV